MSDISIPGVNSRFNTESLVQELVDAETIRLTRMKDQVEEYQTERRVWQELNLGLGNLRSSTRNLFSFENPFSERNAISGNESLLRAQADRAAAEGTTKIRVLQTAQADRFISQDIDEDLQVDQGVYRFTVGEEAITLRFRGGSVREFSDALNRRNPELLRSSVVKNRPGNQVILIESLKEGASHPLAFEEDARDLAREFGWVEEVRGVEVDLSTLETGGLEAGGLETGRVEVRSEDGTVTVAPQAQLSIPFSEPVNETGGLFLQYELRLTTNEDYRYTPLPGPPGPSSPDPGSVSLRDVTLPNLPSVPDVPEREEPEVPEIVEEGSIIFALNGEQVIPLPDVQDSADFLTVQVPISDYTSRLDAIEIRNINSLKELTIKSIVLFDPNVRGNLRPKDPIATVRNALVEVEGILVERESNSIDDIIPGVNLELRRSSEEEIEVIVEPDLDLVKESLIEWVARYNQVIRDTNILTRRDQDIIDEIEYFTDEERERYGQRLGLFQGDSTLNTLRQRLQTLTSSSYETGAGPALSLLTQIGIGTNTSQGSTGLNVSRLRGYLEINESVLDQALAGNFLAVKDLFGRDTDGDLVVDQGVGYQIDQFVQSFVETGGILSSRTSRYDTLISSSNDEIRDYEEYLEDYEADVRRQFATMESAINSLESSSQGLQNLNPNNNRNNN